jgi:hypothetical protein
LLISKTSTTSQVGDLQISGLTDTYIGKGFNFSLLIYTGDVGLAISPSDAILIENFLSFQIAITSGNKIIFTVSLPVQMPLKNASPGP